LDEIERLFAPYEVELSALRAQLGTSVSLDRELIVNPGDQLFIIGRRGTIQRGEVIRYESTVNLGGLLNESERKYASAFVVKAHPISGSHSKDYQVPGDSGSWAFTFEGKLAGMFFMSTRDDLKGAFGVGHLIPISELLADIEKLTGARVEIPS
jgi:hypothetical protein